MMYEFKNKTVLITGAAGGIGRECAQLFNEDGARVILVDLDRALSQEVADSLVEPSRAIVVAGDITDENVLAEVVTAVEQAGGVDALIPAAGIYRDASVESLSFHDWRQTMSINLDAVFRLTQAVLPHIHDHGSIVNFASLAGSRGSRNHAHYAATKAALVAFGRSLALETGERGIRVNAVSPGIIRTTMTDSLVATNGDLLLQQTPLGRHGTAREVATVVTFLCSEAASFVNGELIHVNGGLYMAG